ncbi:uncharacterized protein FIBRA_07310 [Fibroporia radiculosa]|uniref:Major facilitator superfamily (MFS) profile domain-containing protein n=1 Tax=Fibroporia radiculosa TaxID=599839 RepID=J4GE31_9APHY|nr:uncharacterized protein FIBRA_07310 [Fibroporia radiculosa]CCM05103.1 predicted protein [Fibroporia radiculosa]
MSQNEIKSDGSGSETAVVIDDKLLDTEAIIPVLADADTLSDGSIPIPDGGLWAWLAILGGWSMNFCTVGYSTSFGVCQDYYVLAGASTNSNISWIGSLQLFLTFIVGLPAGRLFDLGYFRPVVTLGSFLFVFSLFMLSLADPSSYYQLLLSQGIGMGLAGGLLLTPSLAIQSHYWKKRRAMALGIVQSGSPFGGVVYPIMLNRLFNGSAGFAWGIRASAFLSLGLLLIANCIMRTRLPGGKNRLEGSKPSVKSIMTHKPYVLAVLAMICLQLGIFFPYFYLQSWSRYYNLSDTLAFYMIAILNTGAVFGRMIPNAIADYAGQLNTFCPMICVTAILLFAMFGTTTPGAIVIFAILYGFFSGACLSLLPAALSLMAKTPAEVGNRIGFCFFIMSFATLTGNPIDGALLGPNNQWYKALLFNGILMVVGSSLLLTSRWLLAKERGTQLLYLTPP